MFHVNFLGWKPVPYKSKSAIKKIGLKENKSFSGEFESSKVGDYYLNSRLDFRGVGLTVERCDDRNLKVAPKSFSTSVPNFR